MKPCPGPWVTPSIGWDGKVTVCCKDITFKINMGNINDKKLKEIWHSEEMNELRIKHIKNELRDVFPCCVCDGIEDEIFNIEYLIDYVKKIKRYDLLEYLEPKSNEKARVIIKTDDKLKEKTDLFFERILK